MNKLHSTFKSVATKAIGLSGAIAASCMTLAAQPAQAINFSFAPNDFTLTSGVGSNSAAASSTINTTGIVGSATSNTGGFNNAFSDIFVLLGANPGNTLSNDNFTGNNTTFLSNTTIGFDAFQVTQPIQLSFNSAFYGTAGNSGNNLDNFSISLRNISTGDEFTFLSRNSSSQYGAQNNQVVNISGGGNFFNGVPIVEGTYQLQLSLVEGTNTTGNSAAGFNNIQLDIAEPVPFGFSTNASLIVFGGVFYGLNRMRKKMAAKKLEM